MHVGTRDAIGYERQATAVGRPGVLAILVATGGQTLRFAGAPVQHVQVHEGVVDVAVTVEFVLQPFDVSELGPRVLLAPGQHLLRRAARRVVVGDVPAVRAHTWRPQLAVELGQLARLTTVDVQLPDVALAAAVGYEDQALRIGRPLRVAVRMITGCQVAAAAGLHIHEDEVLSAGAPDPRSPLELIDQPQSSSRVRSFVSVEGITVTVLQLLPRVERRRLSGAGAQSLTLGLRHFDHLAHGVTGRARILQEQADRSLLEFEHVAFGLDDDRQSSAKASEYGLPAMIRCAFGWSANRPR